MLLCKKYLYASPATYLGHVDFKDNGSLPDRRKRHTKREPKVVAFDAGPTRALELNR
jgi:hypothetical protein